MSEIFQIQAVVPNMLHSQTFLDTSILHLQELICIFDNFQRVREQTLVFMSCPVAEKNLPQQEKKKNSVGALKWTYYAQSWLQCVQ